MRNKVACRKGSQSLLDGNWKRQKPEAFLLMKNDYCWVLTSSDASSEILPFSTQLDFTKIPTTRNLTIIM